MGLSEVLILVMAIAGFAAGYLAAVLRHGDTKEGTPSASHNSSRVENCPSCGWEAYKPIMECGNCHTRFVYNAERAIITR